MLKRYHKGSLFPINLDDQIIHPPGIESFDSTTDDFARNSEAEEGNGIEWNNNLPKRKNKSRTQGGSCRELMSRIKSLTYKAHDVDELESLEDTLKWHFISWKKQHLMKRWIGIGECCKMG